MTSRIFIITVAALVGMVTTLTAEAFSIGSGSSNPHPGQRGMRSGPAFSQRSHRGIRLEKGANEKGYYLTIHLGGMAPENLLVQPMHGALLISSSRMSQSETSDQAPGRSYRFSRSFGSFNKRVSLPFDADTENMQRTDSDGVVTLFLPHKADQGQEQGFGPGSAPEPGQIPDPGYTQGSGPGLPPPSGNYGQGMAPTDQSQYPIPDQAPAAGNMSSAAPAAPYGSGQGPGFAGEQMPGPGFDQGFGRGFPPQSGFAAPYGGYGRGGADPYGQNQPPPPAQLPLGGEIQPADPGYQAGGCTCPCPCPGNTTSTNKSE